MAPVDDEIFDPNEILKDIVEESGLDETTLARIFEYIDLQPDGWQPAAIQGILQMYISPTAANKLSQRYQAELYKEEKKRDRDRQMMGIIGTPSGSMRLFDGNQGMNFPPMSNPLRQNYPQNNNSGFNQPAPGFNQPAPGFAQNGDQFPPRVPDYQFPRAPAPRTVSPFEIERMIDAKLDGVVEKLAKAMGESKREELAAQEAKEMRMMMLELLKTNMASKNTGEAVPDPMLAKLMEGQSSTLSMLMAHALNKSKDDDPMNNPLMKILLNQALAPKNSTSAPPLANTSEELSQRIQLQRLANELELSQAEFKDKQESRAFQRDLAGQALSKIGESVAAAYIETQRIQAEAAKEIAATQASAMASSNHVSTDAQVSEGTTNITETHAESTDQDSTHKVRGVPTEDGSVKMPCPTCGSDMFAKPGDTQVKCERCGTVYNAAVPKTTHVNGAEQVAQPVDTGSKPSPEPVDTGSEHEHETPKPEPVPVEPPKRVSKVLL